MGGVRAIASTRRSTMATARRRPARRAITTTSVRRAASPNRWLDDGRPLGRAAGRAHSQRRAPTGWLTRERRARLRARHQTFEEQVDHAVGELARGQLAVGAVPLVHP